MGMKRSHKSRRPTLMLSILAVTGVLGIWAAAQAFTVQYFKPHGLTLPAHNPNHEDITRRALGAVVATLSNGSTVQFTDVTTEYVAQAVAYTDSLYYDIAKVHFDDETFFDGQVRLQDMRKSVPLEALNGNFEDAQGKLSQALHTVEDFYAHSTWVEQNPFRTDVANLGRPGSIAGGLVQAENVPTCSAQATQTLTGIQGEVQSGILITGGTIPLTSEYFTYSQEIDPNTDWRISTSLQKCIHGISDINNNSSNTVVLPDGSPIQFYGYGINKDDVHRDFFSKARDLATTAAQQYVEDILGDIRADNTAADADRAICGLLGQDPLTCANTMLTPPHPKISVGQQQVFTLQFSGVALPGTSYAWTVAGVGSVSSPFTTVNYVTYSAGDTLGPATVSVIVSDANGNKLATKFVTFTVSGVIEIMPANPMVQIGSQTSFSVSALNGGSLPANVSYQWTLAGDGSIGSTGIVNTGTDPTITYTAPNSGGTTATLTVQILDPQGNVLASKSTLITITGRITYNINQRILSGSVVGQVITDGALGVLTPADILGWNLTLNGVGASTTLTSVGGQSGLLLVGQDLTATAQKLYFNYSGTDQGYFAFQASDPGFYSGQKYWCNNTTWYGCATGASVVPQSYDDPSAQYDTSESGNQIIGQAATPSQ